MEIPVEIAVEIVMDVTVAPPLVFQVVNKLTLGAVIQAATPTHAVSQVVTQMVVMVAKVAIVQMGVLTLEVVLIVIVMETVMAMTQAAVWESCTLSCYHAYC